MKAHLSDIERKVLRIFINVSSYGHLPVMPSIRQHMRWTGRNKKEVYDVLASLNEKTKKSISGGRRKNLTKWFY